MARTRVQSFFAKECRFIAGANNAKALPKESLPEFAFWGRSNVGKSSLINALVGQKALARTSRTPGRTQQINFFNLAARLHLVDLPGYGHAKVSHTQSHAWGQLINHFVQTRSTLKRLYILVDGRHGFMKNDIAVMDYLNELGIAFKIILTKIDKADAATIVPLCEAELAAFPMADPDILVTSAAMKTGIDDLQKDIMSQMA
jgi:GTP-binding protein